MAFTPIDYMDEMIDRLVEQGKEAVPEHKAALAYLAGPTYANFPHWRFGLTALDGDIEAADFATYAHTVVGRLYGGAIDEGFDGTAEQKLRIYASRAFQFFHNNLRLQSSVTTPNDYTKGMRYLAPSGVQLERPIITIREEDGVQYMFAQFTWTIGVQLRREAS